VTVALAFKVTLHVTVFAEVHPDHALKVCVPAVAGAVMETTVPEL
jgi:hypothetical protein